MPGGAAHRGQALDSLRAGLELTYELGTRVSVIFHVENGALALSRAYDEIVEFALHGIDRALALTDPNDP